MTFENKQIDPLFIDQRQAAARYSYSIKWFERARVYGDGPPYIKRKGKILYPLKLVDEWFLMTGLQSSTSENKGGEHE